MGRLRPALFSKDMEKELTPQQKAAIEYNRRLRSGQFKKPEALQEKRIFDILIMPEFANILTGCIKEQQDTRDAYLKAVEELKAKGKYVPKENRPVIDRVRELGLMDDAGTFAVEFANVLNGVSEQAKAVREYVRQLGMRAYNMTVEKFICDADPEMAELYKQATTTTKN